VFSGSVSWVGFLWLFSSVVLGGGLMFFLLVLVVFGFGCGCGVGGGTHDGFYGVFFALVARGSYRGCAPPPLSFGCVKVGGVRRAVSLSGLFRSTSLDGN